MHRAAKTDAPEAGAAQWGAAAEPAVSLSGTHDGPSMAAQRQHLHSLLGAATRLPLRSEDEAPVQSRFEPAQRTASQARQHLGTTAARRLHESPRMQAQAVQLRGLLGHGSAAVVQRSSEKVTMNLGEEKDEEVDESDLDIETDDVDAAAAIDARQWLDMTFPVAARFWELVSELGAEITEPAPRTSAGVRQRLHELFDDDQSMDVSFDELLSQQKRLTGLAPTDAATIAYGLSSKDDLPADTDEHDDAVVSVRDQLLGWLMQIALYDLSSAMQNLGPIQELQGRVTSRVAQLADAAMNKDAEAGIVFLRLIACGFVERLVNIAGRGLLKPEDPLCHHTDTSIPLINCIARMTPSPKPAAVRLPGATKNLQETPIQPMEQREGHKRLLKQAGQALTALGKSR